MKRFQERITGYCPEQQKDASILVDFDEIRAIGSNRSAYKKSGYRCAYFDMNGCQHLRTGRCPIFDAVGIR